MFLPAPPLGVHQHSRIVRQIDAPRHISQIQTTPLVVKVNDSAGRQDTSPELARLAVFGNEIFIIPRAVRPPRQPCFPAAKFHRTDGARRRSGQNAKKAEPD